MSEPQSESVPRIEKRAAQPYVGLVREVTAGVPDAVDGAFPELVGWLSEHRVEPAGTPFIRTLEADRDGEALELEVGFPVDAPVAAGGPVRAGVLPAGRYLTVVHTGPYRSETERDIAVARAALTAWAAEREIVYSTRSERGEALACAVDHLLVGPVEESDYTKWKTEFAYLIVED
jgi:GyrI-like small molecule binding domain